MGGFLGGLAGIIGGAGQAAGKYGEQQRDISQQNRALFQQAKMEHLRQLHEMLLNSPMDSKQYADTLALMNQVSDTLPGHEKGSTVAQKVLELLHPHPANVQAMKQAGMPVKENPKPPQMMPGSQVGATPGTGLVPIIGSPELNTGGSPPAAQPSSNPLQQAAPDIPNLDVSPTMRGDGSPLAAAIGTPPAQPTGAVGPNDPTPQAQGGIPHVSNRIPIPDDLQRFVGTPSRAGQALLSPIRLQQAELDKQSAMNRLNLENVFEQKKRDIQFWEQQTGHKFSELSQPAQMAFLGHAIPMSGSLMTPDKLNMNVGGMTTQEKAAYGIPGDARGNWTVEIDKVSRLPIRAVQARANEIRGMDQAGNFSLTDAVAANAQIPPVNLHIMPQSYGTPKNYAMADGGVGQGSAADIAANKPLTRVPGAVTTGMQPRDSVVSAPGMPPIHRRTTVGGSGATATGNSPEVDRITGQHLSQYMQGKMKWSDIPAQYKGLVADRMQQSGMDMPEVLSPKGQSDLAAINPVVKQIRDLKRMLESKGLQNDATHNALTKDYLMYAHTGASTPNNDLFTSLSFESMRSAAAALKQMNARAYPIIQRALAHTPNLDRAKGIIGDTPKTIYDKLNVMEGVLIDGRDEILRDERRSGVVGGSASGVPPVSVSATPPATITPDRQKAIDDLVKKYGGR